MPLTIGLPRVTIIIPVAQNGDTEQVMTSLEELSYPHEKVEIIKSEGCLPAKQRNEAAQMAEGEVLAFFDNDSIVSPEIVEKAVDALRLPGVAVVGGPNLTPPTDSTLQQAIGAALGSRFAHAKMAARYRPIGLRRETDEKELILCNMFVRRNVFMELGGFNEKLYPNEENEFLNRVKSYGKRIIYDPEVVVWRSRRNSLGKFLKQMFSYGRGRGEQLLLEKFESGGLLCLLPLAFMIYLLLLLPLPYMTTKIPILIYFLLGMISALTASYVDRRLYYVLILPFLYCVMHIGYATGTLSGMINVLRGRLSSQDRISKINVVKLKEFGA